MSNVKFFEGKVVKLLVPHTDREVYKNGADNSQSVFENYHTISENNGNPCTIQYCTGKVCDGVNGYRVRFLNGQEAIVIDKHLKELKGKDFLSK